jgi:hypothetical protein
MAMLVSYVQSPEEAVAAQGVRLLLAAVDTLAPALDAPGWAAVVEPVLALAAEDPLQQLAPVQSAGERKRQLFGRGWAVCNRCMARALASSSGGTGDAHNNLQLHALLHRFM